MSPETTTTDATGETLQEQPAPACVMSFNASDPSGAGGLAGDIATIAAMGAHALPVVTTIIMRDTDTGLPAATGREVVLSKPVCIVFAAGAGSSANARSKIPT